MTSIPDNSCIIQKINSNTQNTHALRSKDHAFSVSFKSISESATEQTETMLVLNTAGGEGIFVDRRIIDETDEYINKLKV